MKSTRVSIAQKRADKAYKFAQEAEDNKAEKYEAYVKRLPMLIRTNGLGNALAFLYSKYKKDKSRKDQNGWGLLYLQLDQWFYEEFQGIAKTKMQQLITSDEKPRKPVLMKMIAEESDDFVIRQMTAEVLALTNWSKRFVK